MAEMDIDDLAEYIDKIIDEGNVVDHLDVWA